MRWTLHDSNVMCCALKHERSRGTVSHEIAQGVGSHLGRRRQSQCSIVVLEYSGLHSGWSLRES